LSAERRELGRAAVVGNVGNCGSKTAQWFHAGAFGTTAPLRSLMICKVNEWS